MKLAALLLLALPLSAASLVIDCGSPTDQYFTGGFPYTVQPATDTTLRFSFLPFSYKIPVDPDGPYIVTLRFLEPSNVPPARAFSVTINDKLELPRVSMPGYLISFSRSVIVYSADGFLNLRFDTLIRSAVISSIEVAPLVLTQYIVPSDPKRETIYDAVAFQCPGCDGWYVPRPTSETDSTVPLVYTNIRVWKNAHRGQSQIRQVGNQLVVNPLSGDTWTAGDLITVDYTATWPARIQELCTPTSAGLTCLRTPAP